jgi:hypothetical protein
VYIEDVLEGAAGLDEATRRGRNLKEVRENLLKVCGLGL